MEKEEKVARRRNELREELKSLWLLDRAVSEFGLEYLKSEETPRTPHPMSELDQRIADMGLTNRELFSMGHDSYNHIGPFTDFPFKFDAAYFAGDKNGLVSIDNESMENYVEEVLNKGNDDGFIDWLDREGLVGEGWAARAESNQITTLSLPKEELRTLLFATERAVEITKNEAKHCGLIGAAARLSLPKYSSMHNLLLNAFQNLYSIEETKNGNEKH